MNAIFRAKSIKLLSALLAVLMIIAMLPVTAFAWTPAEGTDCTAAFGDRFASADGDYYYNTGYNVLLYNEDGSTYVAYHEGGTSRWKLMLVDSTGVHFAYCAESGTSYNNGNSYYSTNGRNSKFFQNLPVSAQNGIMLALMYGWHEGLSSPVAGANEDDYAYATQIIIWEYQQQLRTSPTSLTSNNGIDGDTYYLSIKDRPAEKCYDWILDQMSRHYVVPSFASRSESSAQTYTMVYNPDSDEYSVTLTDANNTLADINFYESGITVTRSGNQYTFTSQDMIDGEITVSVQKETNLNMGQMLIWGCPGKQTMVTGAEDPVFFYFKLSTVNDGLGHIVKTSEDGIVEGVRFFIEGDGVYGRVTTGEDGTVAFEVPPGTYTITEEMDDRYEPQPEQSITIVSGQTAAVTFCNTLRRGDLRVAKTAEDGLVKGARFHLYGTAYCGLPVDEYAITDANGIAVFNDVLIGFGYILEEVNTPIRYVIPDEQTASIEWNEVTNRSFDNVLKKWNLTVTKVDRESGFAQGDASLAGAKYGVYKGDELIDTYVTDADGSFTTDYYICGSDWSVKELESSEGYLVTPGNVHIDVDPGNYTAEYNSVALTLDEQVKKGKIAIIKHTDDGETQIETPEVGAEFAIYLKRAGSYDNAKETERDYLICDENGFAQTKDLPYGRYTVKQIKGWEGRVLLAPFEVFVSEDGEIYRYLINNEEFFSYVKVVKVDSTTGKTIPCSGVGFHIFDPSGSMVEMTFTYPTLTTIDTFYTDGDGMLITPEKLEYGKGYSLVEISAPYGYVLNSDPMYFDINEDSSTEENAVTVVVVIKENTPQMGVITVEKTGEYLASVVDTEGGKRLVYDVGGLAGAEYTVSAAEDVYTPDGTLRYSKDEVVATLVTKKDGKAVTEPLFLGRFNVVETKAPYGMILNPAVETVELIYAGQDVEITETSTGFCNERQKVEIDLNKAMEKNKVFGIGSGNEIAAVSFGMFAAEEIVAADGSRIPANGMIETVCCDENGYAAFSADLPAGARTYIREIGTDSHYLLSEEEYPVVFEYAGQETERVHIAVNEGRNIFNKLIYGTIKGYKVDQETGDKISGALFGLFREDESSFTEDNAIMTAESDADGVFTFEKVVFGCFIVRELRPAGGYLENELAYLVTVAKDGEVIELTALNELIPEICTTATINDKKEVYAAEVVDLVDTVEYKHLVPGKEYTIKGILMEKATGKAFLQNGEPVTSEITFVPEAPTGSVEVVFHLNAKLIKTDTSLVVFESLCSGGMELTAHADIEDEAQTVAVIVPEIKTMASTDGKKEITTAGEVTIEDVVTFSNLIPGIEYTLRGTLMNKATGKDFTIKGKPVISEVKFTPEARNGEVKVTFTFDAHDLTASTKLVVFESLCREELEIAAHADIEDKDQTITITPPPDIPQTGDNSRLGVWIGLGGTALGGLAACLILYFKKKSKE